MTATVRVGGLRGYSGLVTELGGDPEKLILECGIAAELLQDEDSLIPYRQLIHLLEHTAAELNLPDFGLRLARVQNIGILGPLAVAIQHSRTVGEAVRCAITYLFVQSPALAMDAAELEDCTRLRIGIHLRNMPHEAMCQAEDLAAAILHGSLKLLAGDDYQLLKVELPHAPLCPLSQYQRYFGAEVVMGASHTAVYVPKRTLSSSLSGTSEQLRRMAVEYLDVQAPAPNGRICGRVETAIRKTLGTENCDRETVARAMAMHPRTLTRHLQQEGETFDGIRDRIRKERAEYYLCRTAAPIAQVAGMIGYSEQSILTRSCKRWFGESPRRVRLRAQGTH